jgi:hypothetical protein
MTSLTRFRQRLRGELPKKSGVQESSQELEEWVKLVTNAHEAENSAIAEEPTEMPIENTDETEIDNLETMTKMELDLYAEEHGIQLDRRQSKFNMITEFIQKLKEKN